MRHNLILASGSKARGDMLRGAGFGFDIIPADIDEDAVKNDFQGNDFEKLACVLSFEKAKAVSNDYKEAYIIGSDQLLIFNTKVLSKAKNKK